MTVLLLGGCVLSAASFISGKAVLLTRTSGITVELDGKRVDADMLGGRHVAILTRRSRGNKHSYEIFYEGDVDPIGDIGL